MAEAFEGLFLRRWTVFSVVLISVLALVSGAYAYWRFSAQLSLVPSSTPYSVAVSSPLELRIELDKTQFQQGEEVAIRLYLKNISNGTAAVEFSTLDGQLGFDVKDPSEKIIYKGNPGFMPAVSKWILEPGGTKSETLKWPQTKETPEKLRPPFEEPVSAGTYKIIGKTGSIIGITGLPVLEQPITITTPPISIVIG